MLFVSVGLCCFYSLLFFVLALLVVRLVICWNIVKWIVLVIVYCWFLSVFARPLVFALIPESYANSVLKNRSLALVLPVLWFCFSSALVLGKNSGEWCYYSLQVNACAKNDGKNASYYILKNIYYCFIYLKIALFLLSLRSIMASRLLPAFVGSVYYDDWFALDGT